MRIGGRGGREGRKGGGEEGERMSCLHSSEYRKVEDKTKTKTTMSTTRMKIR